MDRIGVVGAGAAGAAAAFTLERQLPGSNCTVLEKSRGLGGRAATRRRAGCRYDYGANYLTGDDPGVVELVTEHLDTEGLVSIAEPVWTFDRAGSIEPDRPADEPRWTYRSGLTQLAKRLFGATAADVHREVAIERLSRDSATETWTLQDTDGTAWGPFDVVLLTPPAPQTAALLETTDWDDETRVELARAAAGVDYRTVWTAVAHYPFSLERPYYALVNTDKRHDIGWIARETCKPGHVPEGESLLVVQANHEWSVAHYESDPASNVSRLLEETSDLLGDGRLTEPDWTDHQGWRYALPQSPFAPNADARRSAETRGLYCAGDWVAGEGRLHAAVRNGLDVGTRIARDRRQENRS